MSSAALRAWRTSRGHRLDRLITAHATVGGAGPGRRGGGGGWPLTLHSVRRWRGTLDGLATGMTAVTGEHLLRTFDIDDVVGR